MLVQRHREKRRKAKCKGMRNDRMQVKDASYQRGLKLMDFCSSSFAMSFFLGGGGVVDRCMRYV